MNMHPLSGELVEITADLNADFVKDIDLILTVFQKQSRSQFIEDVLEDWYQRERSGKAVRSSVAM